MLRIREVHSLDGFRVRLTLSDGSTIERNLGALLYGPIFEPVRSDLVTFRQLRVEAGTVVWPNGADLCPDVVIWGGPPPEDQAAAPPASLDAASRRP